MIHLREGRHIQPQERDFCPPTQNELLSYLTPHALLEKRDKKWFVYVAPENTKIISVEELLKCDSLEIPEYEGKVLSVFIRLNERRRGRGDETLRNIQDRSLTGVLQSELYVIYSLQYFQDASLSQTFLKTHFQNHYMQQWQNI